MGQTVRMGMARAVFRVLVSLTQRGREVRGVKVLEGEGKLSSQRGVAAKHHSV